jgi:hypothetical protein
MEINSLHGSLALSLNFYRYKILKRMKTRLFLPLVAILLLSQAVMGQFHIGLKGGDNIAKVVLISF